MDANQAETLFEEYRDFIKKIVSYKCYKFNIQDENCKDCLQTIYEKLIENNYDRIRKFVGNSSFKTYIGTVVHRLFIDNCIPTPIAQRSKSIDDENAPELPSKDPSSEEQLANKRILSALYACIDEMKKEVMTAEDILIFKMRFIDNLTISEIARRIGKTRHKVDYRINHILDLLRKCLKKTGITEEEFVLYLKNLEKREGK
ncbi:RNA polymerase sigma-70 domain protein [Candidatus Magnetoovum chiemensis]|nr:RNA polymerase sigma-70 domain protein [Candidatus Magnetoovum chiemensis]